MLTIVCIYISEGLFPESWCGTGHTGHATFFPMVGSDAGRVFYRDNATKCNVAKFCRNTDLEREQHIADLHSCPVLFYKISLKSSEMLTIQSIAQRDVPIQNESPFPA